MNRQTGDMIENITFPQLRRQAVTRALILNTLTMFRYFINVKDFFPGEALHQSYFLVLVPLGILGNLLSFLVSLIFLQV